MKDSILFVGADYIDTDDVANNWGKKTIYFSGEKIKKQLNQKFTFIQQKRGAGKHENQDKTTESNGNPRGDKPTN